MKLPSIIKVLILTVITLVSVSPAQARSASFNVSSLGRQSDLATAINNKLKNLSYSDTAIINFDKEGIYTLDGVIVLSCNVIMAGTGAESTLLILDKNDRKPLNGSDAFFNFLGKPEHTISVSIHDMGMKLKEHDGIWWENSRFHAVKIYHANKVDISNVNSTMSNAIITNFDLRVCSNVTVEHSTISNYNNCRDGGNLWLRGEMHNINIHHNKFYKYGNDEALAFFSRTVNAIHSTNGNISRSNIKVTDNEFYYQHDDKLIDGLFNDMLFSLQTSEKTSNYSCDLRGFEMARNKFFVNDLCKRILFFQFCESDKHRDIVIHDNEFFSNNVDASEKFYRMDVDIKDMSKQQDTIILRNNNLTNNYTIMNPYSGTGYTFVMVRGGNVLLDGNKINNRINRSSDGKDYGINLLWSGKEGGTATLRNNVCRGLYRIITLESGDGISHFTLNATNNYFQGRTTLYCKKIDRLDLDFRNNTFDSHHDYFFLQDFASKGTLIFNNNKVTVTSNHGQLMGHYGNKTSTSSMRFEKLEIMGNEFRGVKSQNDMTKHITNVRKRTVKSNTFRAL